MKPLKIMTLLFLVAMPLYAQLPPGQWLCFAFDNQNKSYEGMGESLKSAMREAKRSCLKSTHAQRKCKTAQSFCQQGPISMIDDRCIVTDANGRAWNATGPKACKVALSMCKRWQFLHGKTYPCFVKHS